MKEEFIKKLNNKEYISKYLYLKTKEEDSNILPYNFDIDKYNEEE